MTTTVPPVCIGCQRYDWASFRRCSAFSGMPIPDRIWEDLDPHTEPIAGDGGLTFMPLPLVADRDGPVQPGAPAPDPAAHFSLGGRGWGSAVSSWPGDSGPVG